MGTAGAGGNAEIWQLDETGRRVKITGMGASAFEIRYFDGRSIENGGAPNILDRLNSPDLVADFTNQLPESSPVPGDITTVMQWTDLELAPGQSTTLSLIKEYFTPEPSSGLLVMAPLLAMLCRSGKRRSPNSAQS